MSVDTALFLLFIAMMTMIPIWWFLNWRAYRLLEARHPDVYESLGSPGFLFNQSIKSEILSTGFLLKGRWRRLGDPKLERLFKVMRVLFVVYCLIFATALVTFFVTTYFMG